MKPIKKQLFTAWFLIVLSILWNLTSYSQDTEQSASAQWPKDNCPYQLKSVRTGEKYIAINFVDTVTQQVIGSFDLVENNPFNTLNYKVLNSGNNNDYNRQYDFENILLENINLPTGKPVLKEGITGSVSRQGLQGSSNYQATIVGKFLVVKYTFYVCCGELVLGRADAVYIFNEKGNIIKKLDGFDTNVREWALSDNGRYFSYAFGGVLDESLTSFSDVGYKILDLHEDKIVYEENFGDTFNEVRTGTVGNIFVITGYSLDCLYIFIDFSKNKKYSRTFSKKEIGLWKNVEEEGLLMYLGNRKSNSYTLLRFEDDFKVEEIK